MIIQCFFFFFFRGPTMKRPAVCGLTAVLVLCSFWFMGILWSARVVPPLQDQQKATDKPGPLEPRKKRDIDQDQVSTVRPEEGPSVPPAERKRMCFHTNTPGQVTDDRGYMCSPFDVLDSKCCNLARPYVRRFVCNNCTATGCCGNLEDCVSCCMGQDEAKGIPERRRYQQCTSLCRTSHESLRTDQRYKDNNLHHCFQRRPPKINKNPIQERSEIEWMSLN